MIISAWWLRTSSKFSGKESKKQGAVHKRRPLKIAKKCPPPPCPCGHSIKF